MLDETKRLLYDFYKPHNIEMSKIMGDPTFLYEHTFQDVDDTETSLGLMVRNLRLFKDKNKNGRT